MRNPSQPTRREVFLAALGFLAFSLVFIFPAGLTQSKFLALGDGLCSYFPYMLRSFQPLSPGVTGAWDPTLYTGLPESHSPFGRYYPPTLLLYTALPPALSLCLGFVFHQAWAGLGAYLLTRDGGRSRPAAWLAGVVFGFGGFLVFHRGHIPMYECAAWLPWILWSLERFRRSGSFTWVAITGTLLTVHALAGQMQLVVMGGLVWLSYLAYFTVFPSRPWRNRLRFLFGGLAACALGALGSLPQMLPMLEVASWSGYGKFDFDFFHSGSLEVRFLAGLLGPHVLGGFEVSSPGGYWGLTEHGIFYGVLPLVAAVAGLIALAVSPRPRTRGRGVGGEGCLAPLSPLGRGVRGEGCLAPLSPLGRGVGGEGHDTPFWLFLLVASLILMLGNSTPLYDLLAHVPVYRLFHIPARHVWIFGLALAWLSALGLDSLLQADVAFRRCLLSWTTALVLLLLAACAALVATLSDWPDRPRCDYSGFWVPLLSAALALVYLAAVVRTGPDRPWLGRLVPLFAFLELWINIGDYELAHGPPDALTQPDRFPEVVRKLHELEPGNTPPRCLIRAEWWQAAGRDWWVPCSFGSAWGLASLNNYSQSMPDTLARLLLLDPWGHADFDGLVANERRLSAAGGRWIIARGPISSVAPRDDRSPYRVAARCEPDYVIYENSAARPLATLVREVRPAASDQDAVQDIAQAGPPVRELAYVAAPSGDSHGWSLPGPQAFTSGEAQLQSERPDDIAMETNTVGEGFLVLTVTRCRGWSASVDGNEVPIHAVDGPFMGVRIPAGRHLVRFHYRPLLLWIGSALAALALGAAWLGVFLFRRSRLNVRPAPSQSSHTTAARDVVGAALTSPAS